MCAAVRLLKRLGQHFLKDRSVARRIVESLEIEEGDCVVEIGCGGGVLTAFLVESRAERIVGIEIDRRLVRGLKERFGENERVAWVEGDFLDVDLPGLGGRKKLRIVGNLPYYITTPILFKILDNRHAIQDCTVTVQKEVGERMTAGPGTKAYGIPSVLFQVHSRAELLFLIPRHRFVPVPGVDSAVLRLRFLDRPLHEIDDVDFFHDLVKTVFGQRRKMLRNTLKQIVGDEKVLESVSTDLSRRPETLSVAEFVRLSNSLTHLLDRRSLGRDSG